MPFLSVMFYLRIIALSALCLSLPLAANPLAAPPAQVAADYVGRFADAGLELDLQTGGQGFYSGEIRHQGQVYPLQAELQAGALRGTFRSGQESFPFSASWLGNALLLETGGARYTLARQISPNPLLAPGGAPAMPAPKAWQPEIPPVPLVSTDPALLLEEFQPLAEQTGNEFQSFLGTLRQWLSSGQGDSQSNALVQQQLLPLSLSLNAKLGRLGAVAGQMANVVALNQGEAEVLQELAKTSHAGAEYLNEWHGLLNRMLELDHRGDMAALQKLAGERLPPAVKNTLALAKKLTTLLSLSKQIQGIQARREAGNLNPSKLLRLETLRNMSEMMRDGMHLLKDARQK